MKSKHMERCSTLFMIGELQIKTAIKYPYTPITLARFQRKKKLAVPIVGEDVE